MCKGFKGRLLTGELFADYTTFKTGGKIPLYAEPVDEDDLKLILEFFHQQKIPSFILGGGSNIVPDDEGLDFAVISTRCLGGITVQGTDAETLLLTCGSGTPIEKITEFCIENSLSGLEFFAGLPGTAGGAAYMNARCYGASVSDVLVSARCIKCPAEGDGCFSFAEYAKKD